MQGQQGGMMQGQMPHQGMHGQMPRMGAAHQGVAMGEPDPKPLYIWRSNSCGLSDPNHDR